MSHPVALPPGGRTMRWNERVRLGRRAAPCRMAPLFGFDGFAGASSGERLAVQSSPHVAVIRPPAGVGAC